MRIVCQPDAAYCQHFRCVRPFVRGRRMDLSPFCRNFSPFVCVVIVCLKTDSTGFLPTLMQPIVEAIRQRRQTIGAFFDRRRLSTEFTPFSPHSVFFWQFRLMARFSRSWRRSSSRTGGSFSAASPRLLWLAPCNIRFSAVRWSWRKFARFCIRWPAFTETRTSVQAPWSDTQVCTWPFDTNRAKSRGGVTPTGSVRWKQKSAK